MLRYPARWFLIAGLSLACSGESAAPGGSGGGGMASGGNGVAGSPAAGNANLGGGQSGAGMSGSATAGGPAGAASGGSVSGSGGAAAGSGGASGGSGGSGGAAAGSGGVSGGSSGGGSGGAAGAGGGGNKGGKALLVSRKNQHADTALTKRLEGLNFTVKLTFDEDPELPGPWDLIVVSEGAESQVLLSKYVNNPAPIVSSENGYVDVLGLATGGAKHTGKTAIQIATNHPIAAGLTGKVEVYTKPFILTTASKPVSSAVQVATEDGAPDSFALLAVEKGAQLNGFTAPNRRVQWFLEDDASADPVTLNLTDNGWKIFDACVKWATAQP